MRNIIEIDPNWLMEFAGHYYKSTDILEDTDVTENTMKPALKKDEEKKNAR